MGEGSRNSPWTAEIDTEETREVETSLQSRTETPVVVDKVRTFQDRLFYVEAKGHPPS